MQWFAKLKINILNKVWIGEKQTEEFNVENILRYVKIVIIH